MRPSPEAVALWDVAYAQQVRALFEASTSDDPRSVLRVAEGHARLADAWRALAGDVSVALWARHACAVAAVEFSRRARLELARVAPEENERKCHGAT